nr:hypothetical protein Iba_chr02dCG4250 [Ipomoea batatas]
MGILCLCGWASRLCDWAFYASVVGLCASVVMGIVCLCGNGLRASVQQWLGSAPAKTTINYVLTPSSSVCVSSSKGGRRRQPLISSDDALFDDGKKPWRCWGGVSRQQRSKGSYDLHFRRTPNGDTAAGLERQQQAVIDEEPERNDSGGSGRWPSTLLPAVHGAKKAAECPGGTPISVRQLQRRKLTEHLSPLRCNGSSSRAGVLLPVGGHDDGEQPRKASFFSSVFSPRRAFGVNSRRNVVLCEGSSRGFWERTSTFGAT